MEQTKLDQPNIDVVKVARKCHEMNRAYCSAIGDDSQVCWEDAPQWQRDSAINGVIFHMQNPDRTPEQSHINWLAEKIATGWKFGPVKDVYKKEHPCCLPYEQLPMEQRLKDVLFITVVANEVLIGNC